MAPPLVKKALPPSRIVATEMLDRIKESLAKITNSYGADQAERLKRAADEGANLGLYTPRALERAVAGEGHLITALEPGRFQDFSARIPDKAFLEDPYNVAMNYRFKPGFNKFENVMETYGDIGRESGWSEVPELRFSMGRKQPLLHDPDIGALLPTKEEYPYVMSHEGRHRSMAIDRYLQEPKSLVVIRPHAQLDLRMMPAASDEERLEYFKQFLRSRDSRVVPEEKNYSPLLDRGLTEKTLPKLGDLYAKGGEVHAREGGWLRNLIKRVANEVGEDQGRRFERLADLTNLERFNETALLDQFVRYRRDDPLTVIEPHTFENFANAIPKDVLQSKPPYYKDPKNGSFDEYIERLGNIAQTTGLNEFPSLTIDSQLLRMPDGRVIPRISGHEGRHRMRALTGVGDTTAPVSLAPWGNRDRFLDSIQNNGGNIFGQRATGMDFTPGDAEFWTKYLMEKFPNEVFAEGGEVEHYQTGGQRGRLRGALQFRNFINEWFGDHSAAAINEAVDETAKTGMEAARFGFGNKDTGQGWLSAPAVGTPVSANFGQTTDAFAGGPGIYMHTPGRPHNTGYDRFRTDADSRYLPEGFQVHTHPPLDLTGLPEYNVETTKRRIAEGQQGPLAPSVADLENWMYPDGNKSRPSDPRFVSYIAGSHPNALLAMGDPDIKGGWGTPADAHERLKRALEASAKGSALWRAMMGSDAVIDVLRDYGTRGATRLWAPLVSNEIAKTGMPITIDGTAPFGKGYLEGALQDLFKRLSSKNEDLAGITYAQGGEVQHYGSGGQRGALRNFVDKASKYIDDWKWAPLDTVAEKMPTDIPDHVLGFGEFMRKMSNIAATEGLTPEDLMKAYTTTRSSIQRQAIGRHNLDTSIPLSTNDSMVRPEGAFSDWLRSPMGERYLQTAAEGEAHPDTIESARRFMQPFGFHNTLAEDLKAAPSLFPGKEGVFSKLIARNARGEGDPSEWHDVMRDIPGIDASKRGFFGSMLGYGDLPTLDARQLILNAPETREGSEKFMRRGRGTGAEDAVSRLRDRISALDFGLPKELRPFYQHLGHHTMWDAQAGDMTTHSDIVRSMLNRAEGGPVQHFKTGDLVRKGVGALSSGSEENLLDRAARVTGRLREELLNAVRSKKAGVAGDEESVRGISSRMGPQWADEATARIIGGEDAPRPIVTPEDIRGGILVGGMSDRTPAGNWLQSVGGVPLSRSIFTQGGSDYPMHHPYLWASDTGPLNGMVNAIDRERARLKELYPNLDTDALPSYFTNKLMGYQAGDQSHMTMEGVVDLLKNAQYSRATEQDFNDFVRKRKHSVGGKNIPPMPDFPGVRSKNLEEYLMDIPMSHRSKLLANMDNESFNDRGIPNPTSLRLALTDPHLLFAPEGTPGRTIGRFDIKDALDRLPPSEAHGSYPTGLKGDFMGGFDRILPPEAVFPRFWNDPETLKKARPQQMSSFRNKPVVQYLDQEWLDNIMPIWEKTQRGWAHGGMVGDNDPPYFDYHTPEIGSEGSGALSLGANNVDAFGFQPTGYARGGAPSVEDLDDAAWYGVDALSGASNVIRDMDRDALEGTNRYRITPTPALRRSFRNEAIANSQPRIDEINRDAADFWRDELANLRAVDYHPMKYGLGAMHRIGSAMSPEGPSPEDLASFVNPDPRLRDEYGPIAAPLDVLGIIAGAATGGGALGRISKPVMNEAMPMMRKLLGASAAPVTARAVTQNYDEGGAVDGYRYGHEADWAGVPGESMYAGGGAVHMKDGGFLHDLLGTIGGIAGNLIPIPFVGPAIGKFAGHTLGNVFEGGTSEIGDDAARDFTMGMVDPDTMGFARGGNVDDDALLYHAIDTQNFARGGALRACGGYAR